MTMIKKLISIHARFANRKYVWIFKKNGKKIIFNKLKKT